MNAKKRTGLSTTRFGRFLIIVMRRRRLVEKLGIISVVLTAGQYFFTYGDRVEERQAKDWDQLRVVQLALIDRGEWTWKGNLGVGPAMERLTKDCPVRQWLFWPLTYFQQDCVELKSLRLETAELANLSLRYAVVSTGSFRCSNLNNVDFRNADVTQSYFGGASMKAADLRGANFSSWYRGGVHYNPLFFANLTDAKFNDDTAIPPEKLQCACVEESGIKIEGAKFWTAKIPRCPSVNICEELGKMGAEAMAKKYGLPEQCILGAR